MKPYFAVGEEVILCSKKYPEINGEYSIHGIIFYGDEVRCRLTGLIMKTKAKFGYTLDDPIKDPNCKSGTEGIFDQSCLRKKHDPCGESYSKLIQSTKQLVKS